MRLACGVLTVTKGDRLRAVERAVPPSCRDRFPQRSWYQDPGTKILVPKKNGESERRSLSVCRGARGLQAPRQGVWAAGSPPGRAGRLGGPPVRTILWTQNHLPTTFGHFQPSANHLLTTFNHLQTTFNNLPTTFQPPSNHLQPLLFYREKVKPITTPPDKVFERPG